MFRVAILTIIDRSSKGEQEDISGPLIEEMIKNLSAQVIYYEMIPDEKEQIAEGEPHPNHWRNRFKSKRCNTGCNTGGDRKRNPRIF